MEKLLSKQDIKDVELEAQTDLDTYLGGVVVRGETTEKSIITISKDKQLIFIEGNEHTGFSHLRDRHYRFSFKNYWIATEKGSYRLDNPSKFHPAMMPIIDFVKIADNIFSIDNLNHQKNKRPDFFDMYTGYYSYTENKKEKYHLLTYKDSQIVHSLFPDNKKNNAKRKCRFGKGIVTTSLKFLAGHNDLLVPYEINNGLTAYSILVRKFYSEKIERIFIQKHNNSGEVQEQYFIGYKEFEEFEIFSRETINDFQIGDLSEFEKIITQINDNQA